MQYILAIIVMCMSLPAWAEPPVRVSNAYAYATAELQKNGAVFMAIENPTDQAVKITHAETNVSERVELHTHDMDGGIMMMRKVEDFNIEPQSSISLDPTGKHIMLMGLKAPLKTGETFPLSIVVDGQSVTVDVRVVKPGDVQ